MVTLAFWQAAHSLHQRLMSEAMPFQTKRVEIILLDALMPGWAKECITSKTFFCHDLGTTGHRLRSHSKWCLSRLVHLGE